MLMANAEDLAVLSSLGAGQIVIDMSDLSTQTRSRTSATHTRKEVREPSSRRKHWLIILETTTVWGGRLQTVWLAYQLASPLRLYRLDSHNSQDTAMLT